MAVLVDRFGVSERHACRVVGQHRSTPGAARPARVPEGRAQAAGSAAPDRSSPSSLGLEDRPHDHPPRADRQPQAHPAPDWHEEGLKRPQMCRKRRRLGPTVTGRLRATHPNQVSAIDFQFDETSDGRRLKLTNIVDEFTHEALAMRVGRSCNTDQLIDIIENLAAARGAPEHLRMDNGPELVAWGLREWCRLAGTRTGYIEPGSPWENPFVESFNGRFRMNASTSSRRPP